MGQRTTWVTPPRSDILSRSPSSKPPPLETCSVGQQVQIQFASLQAGTTEADLCSGYLSAMVDLMKASTSGSLLALLDFVR